MKTFHHIPTVAAALLLAANLWADLPAPRLDRIAPLGAGAGQTIDLETAGADDAGADRLIFDHPGITAQFVSEHKFKVTVAADVPAGTYDARLVGRFGVTSPRLFQVTHKLTELAEKEPNNTPATAQELPIGSVVNAVSDGNEFDVYRIAGKAGQRIVCDCLAGRLDSQLDAVMTLTTLDGRILASSSDYFGRDPMIDYRFEADGECLLSVNDLSYRGGFLYRLIVERSAADRKHRAPGPDRGQAGGARGVWPQFGLRRSCRPGAWAICRSISSVSRPRLRPTCWPWANSVSWSTRSTIACCPLRRPARSSAISSVRRWAKRSSGPPRCWSPATR